MYICAARDHRQIGKAQLVRARDVGGKWAAQVRRPHIYIYRKVLWEAKVGVACARGQSRFPVGRLVWFNVGV